MQSGSFAHSLVIREWPSRHCFISLPRPWVSHILRVSTPTFSLEFSEERSLLLSWAGDTHNPDPGNEDAVLVSREVLRTSGIRDGEIGIITQAQVPPSCSSVTVCVGSLTEWQDLALNAEDAQSAFLNQVRVLGVGQCLPLWLEGGVRITLTVTRIDPPHKFGILQPMTQVEVLPPVDQEESKGFCPISFTPGDAESLEPDTSGDRSQDIVKTVEVPESRDSCNLMDVKDQKTSDHNAFDLLMKYLAFRLQQRRVTAESHPRKDFRIGYKVLPAPQASDSSSLWEFIVNHPTLVVISKQSLLHVQYRNKIHFISRIARIDSPREKLEKTATNREDENTTESKQPVVSVSNSAAQKSVEKLCTVIVWENFVKEKGENTKFMDEMTAIVKENNCIISNCLRRLMKLEVSSVVELSSLDVNMKTLPLTLDITPLKSAINVDNRAVCDIVKRMLRDYVEEADLVLNSFSLLNIDVEDKNTDVLVSIRDGVPLKLTKESVVLLEVTHVSDPSNVPHITGSVADLDVRMVPKFPYVGNEKVLSDLERHVLLGLGLVLRQYEGVPQFALVHGSKGSGKTSLIETVVQKLSKFPYFLHSQIVNFKTLKGKKMETVEKKLHLVFREAIFRWPSVIVLEDLDCLVPSKGLEDQDSGPLHDHTMKMVNMLRGLLDDLLEYCHSSDILAHNGSRKSGGVMVVATASHRTGVHPLLVNPQGCHYFPCSFGIPPLEPSERVRAFNSMVEAYLVKLDCCVGSQKRCANSVEGRNGDHAKERNSIETVVALKVTENFVLPDLSHLAFRTYLQARQRWGRSAEQSKCCLKCGNAIKRKSENTSSSLLSLAITENSYDHESDHSVVNSDLQAARQGYIPLALRGLELSEKQDVGNLQVGGLVDAQKTLKETLTWPSAYPNLFSKIKLRLRSGVLLYGPPGCGKTLLANSVAENCQLNFISVKGPELLSKYIGASEQAVRDAFERASCAKPCILFFDEFESIAPRRGHDSTGVTDRVVNQLLTQMDGVEGLTGVYILAATSRPDLIDPALLRPGRLDKCVFCPMPSLADREDILRNLGQSVDLGEEIDWAEIAGVTNNYSGADLQSILSTAQILVAQEALGEALYEGVILPSDNDGHKLKSHDLIQDFSGKEPTENTPLVQVAVEKEKVRFTRKKRSTQDECAIVDDTEKSMKCSNYLNQSSQELLKNDEGREDAQKTRFKVCKMHIEAALKEVKPSVTVAERLKYEQLYSSFSKSRDGNFGKHTPGKKVTLA